MNIIETIKIRKSTRTFNPNSLNPLDKSCLEIFLQSNCMGLNNQKIDLSIIEKKNLTKLMKLDYGIIKGHNSYILGLTKADSDSRVNYGYLVEKAVLKATEMNLASCWVGYFDPEYFDEFEIQNGFEIPSIVIIGYPDSNSTVMSKLLRFSAKSSKRASWDLLFFDYETNLPLNIHNKYNDSLEMLRLAPSSGNTQPWRVFYDNIKEEFHFYKKVISKKYEKKGLHDIDMGIAMSHFELTSFYNGLNGKWIQFDVKDIKQFANLKYIWSWKSI